ncbi:MAG: acyltransferase family protein [Chloroflexi bacterium]|nr:acyltransferase family protein [Chloroflexota bacterium]
MTESPTPRPRVLWVDIVRAVSAFGVVFTHVTMNIVYYWDKKPLVRGDEIWWTTGVFYAFLARSALGLFFMISGYLLLPTLADTFTFLKKRLWKLLLPLAFWGTFYYFWRGQVPEEPVKALKFILVSLLAGNVEFHLWFLYAFVGVYLFVPILSIFIRHAKESDIWYYAAIWFLVGPIFTQIFWRTEIYIALAQLGYFSGYTGFFLLGYLLGRRDLDRRWTLASWLLIPLWAAAETFAMRGEVRATKFMDDQWFEVLTVHVAPYTVVWFIALKGLGQRVQARLAERSRAPAVWEAMSRASLGVILVHIFILDIMYKGFGGLHLAPSDFHPALSVPIVSVVCYLISFALVYVIQRIPLAKHIVAS